LCKNGHAAEQNPITANINILNLLIAVSFVSTTSRVNHRFEVPGKRSAVLFRLNPVSTAPLTTALLRDRHRCPDFGAYKLPNSMSRDLSTKLFSLRSNVCGTVQPSHRSPRVWIKPLCQTGTINSSPVSSVGSSA
jgi:hypothetical protein